MMRSEQKKIVIITRKTRLDDLKAQYNTVGQARFMKARAQESRAASTGVESLGEVALVAEKEFKSLESEADLYSSVIGRLRQEFDFGLPVQVIDRQYLPTLVLGPQDIIVTVGQDGLVANAAKYALGLPVIGINPNPAQYDGILLPFQAQQARSAVLKVLEGKARYREVTLAEVRLLDGQRLLAFNDLFIGARSHTSARYKLEVAGRREPQSSSGLLVSTGAGSTGWLSSVINMAAGVAGGIKKSIDKITWEDRKLIYVVREPFISKRSSAQIVMGELTEGNVMTIESMMSTEGVIFSDGIEADYLAFGEGAIATIGIAKERARLVVA